MMEDVNISINFGVLFLTAFQRNMKDSEGVGHLINTVNTETQFCLFICLFSFIVFCCLFIFLICIIVLYVNGLLSFIMFLLFSFFFVFQFSLYLAK